MRPAAVRKPFNFSPHQPFNCLHQAGGDFSRKEIDMAIQQLFLPALLGETRLRTETAGAVAAITILKLF